MLVYTRIYRGDAEERVEEQARITDHAVADMPHRALQNRVGPTKLLSQWLAPDFPLTRPQPVERPITDTNAYEPQGRVAHGGCHAADLPVAAFGGRDERREERGERREARG